MSCRWALFLLIFVAMQNYSQSTLPNTNDIKSVMKYLAEIQFKMDSDYNLKTKPHRPYTLYSADTSKIYTDMTNLLIESRQLSQKSLDDFLNDFLETFALYELDNSTLLEATSKTLQRIKYRYQADDNFLKYITTSYGQLNNLTYLCTFAENCFQFLSQPSKDDLNVLFFGFINSIVDRLQEHHVNGDLCNLKTTLQREFHLFLKVLMQKHIQEYILHAYAWALKNKCTTETNIKQKSWTAVNILIRNKFITDFKRCISISKIILEAWPRSIYRCDRKNQARDITYFEMERMFQTFIANEYELNTEKSCSYNCDFPKKTIAAYKDDTQCEKIMNCKYLTATLNTCIMNNKPRRLEWFEDSNGIIYGSNNKSSCSGNRQSFASYIWGWRMCDFCVCTCKGQQTSDVLKVVNAISFRDQTSNIQNNMVVVGIRFIKKYGLIHVQIKEGKLLPQGVIDEHSVAWKPLEDTTYDNKAMQHMIVFNNGTSSPLTYGRDYGRPSMINLDDIVSPKDYLVTGVRLKFIRNWLTATGNKEGAVELQVQVTPFDFSQGTLIDLNQMHWISPEYLEERSSSQPDADVFEAREELKLETPDNPIKSSENIPDSRDNQFIKFSASDMKKDAGQSTVPFFDGQPVEGLPSFPLSGIGLFHKGFPGFGGYLAFKIFDINLSDYMNEN